MPSTDLQVIKDIPGYKVILKAVLKSQIQELVRDYHYENMPMLYIYMYIFLLEVAVKIENFHLENFVILSLT